ELTKNSIVGAVVADNFRAADVFKKYGIDFCCGGNITIAEAAEKANGPVDDLLESLNAATAQKDLESDLLQRLELDALADYIVERHHAYVSKNIKSKPPYLEKLAQVHGDRHPELYKVRELFAHAAEAIMSHISKEEAILFPRIRQLVAAKHQGSTPPPSPFGSIANPISAMHKEHDDEGERFRLISELTNGYTVPQDGCNTYRVGLAKLHDFENDLHRHIHLENNILFPRAIELEKNL